MQWEIPNFSERPAKIFSDVFEVGGFSWQLLCFPKGNKPGQLSLFLAVPDIDEQPVNWQRSASFKLSVLSALGPEHNAVKETQHTFQGMENDWGFNNFISRAELENAARGLLNEDTIRVKVRGAGEAWWRFETRVRKWGGRSSGACGWIGWLNRLEQLPAA